MFVVFQTALTTEIQTTETVETTAQSIGTQTTEAGEPESCTK